MLVSLNWLKELVDIPADASVLAKRLTDTGTEIEGMEEPVPLFRGALTARVETIESHPSRQDLLVLGIDSSGAEKPCALRPPGTSMKGISSPGDLREHPCRRHGDNGEGFRRRSKRRHGALCRGDRLAGDS